VDAGAEVEPVASDADAEAHVLVLLVLAEGEPEEVLGLGLTGDPEAQQGCQGEGCELGDHGWLLLSCGAREPRVPVAAV